MVASGNNFRWFVTQPLFDATVILGRNDSFPRISIVTPSFNQVHFLERTILSVLNQNYPNLEYIIVDGGSTDGSLEVIKRYEKYLTRWVSEKDHGQADAIRKGFEWSTGEIMAWLNSDDVYLPGTLEKVARSFQNFPDVDIIYGDLFSIDPEDKVIRRGYFMGKQFDFRILLFTSSLPQQATFWRAGIYWKAGGIRTDLQFCMDYDLWLRFFASGGTFLQIDEVLAGFRIHPSSKTSNLQEIHWRERRKLQEEFLGRKLTSWEHFFLRYYHNVRRHLFYPRCTWEALRFRLRSIGFIPRSR